MKIELPPPLPEKDNNRVVRRKGFPEKQHGGSASKAKLETLYNTQDCVAEPKSTASERKLEKKSILLIQEFIAGLFQVDRYEDVLHLSLITVEHAPDYVDAYYNGALALFHLQRYPEAKDLLERAPEIIWNLGNPNYNMACIEVALGNYQSAINYAKSAAIIDPPLLKEMQNDADLLAIHKELKAIK